MVSTSRRENKIVLGPDNALCCWWHCSSSLDSHGVRQISPKAAVKASLQNQGSQVWRDRSGLLRKHEDTSSDLSTHLKTKTNYVPATPGLWAGTEREELLGLLEASLAPGSRREQASEWYIRSPGIFLWSLHMLTSTYTCIYYTCIHYPHMHAYTTHAYTAHICIHKQGSHPLVIGRLSAILTVTVNKFPHV